MADRADSDGPDPMLTPFDGRRALRGEMQLILDRAIAASMPGPGVLRHLEDPAIGDEIARCRRLSILAVGKAAFSMTEAALSWLGERSRCLEELLVIVPEGDGLPMPRLVPPLSPECAKLARVNVIYAGHPLPTEESLRAGREAARLARDLGEGDVLLFLGSGGASALMELPVEGVSLDDLVREYGRLMASGLSIHEMNRERAKMSQSKAGGLLRCAKPARVVQILLSDVPGDDVGVIGSGPFVPVVDADAGGSDVTGAVAVMESVAGERDVAPVTTRLAGSSATALDAAVQAARDCGLFVLALTSVLQGDAASAGRVFAAIAREIARCDRPVPRPCAVLATGETVVHLPSSHGRGGRNQHLALAAALDLEGMDGVLLASVGTDGRDGPTDAAGALVDGSTIGRIRAAGLDPAAALRDCDAYSVLSAAGALLRPGPTGTNVNDLIVMLLAEEGPL